MDCLLAQPWVKLGAVSCAPSTRWRHYATTMLVTGAVLAGAVLAGCSSQPAVTQGSVTSCFRFVSGAIQHHVAVTAMPAACQGPSQVEVNEAVTAT